MFILASLAACRLTARPSPTALLPSLAAPSPAIAAPAIPTPTPANGEAPSALTIAAMRAKSYPGSDLSIEQTLPPGPNYNRYIASYQSDDLKLFGLLTVPTGDKPAGGWPVILLNHGYIPPGEYSTVQSYASIVAKLASSGFIIFKPDYRGNGNSPGSPNQPYVSPDYVTDSLNALASIRRYKDADPNRVGIWGHSMGGNITLHELVISHDMKAAVLMAGAVGSYSDLIDWWRARVASGVLTTPNDIETNRLVNEIVEAHGTPQSNPGFWNPIDPTQFISDIGAPVLIQVGSADTVVPPSFSEHLAAQLQSAGRSVQYHVYPDANHNLVPDTASALDEAIAFFNQYLR
jgi:dipeptidyl aminopeptidase/acylaminoacyl peptidase